MYGQISNRLFYTFFIHLVMIDFELFYEPERIELPEPPERPPLPEPFVFDDLELLGRCIG